MKMGNRPAKRDLVELVDQPLNTALVKMVEMEELENEICL